MYIYITYFLQSLKRWRMVNFINTYYIVIYGSEYLTTYARKYHTGTIHSLICVSTRSDDK